jgi:hypothetical protein
VKLSASFVIFDELSCKTILRLVISNKDKNITQLIKPGINMPGFIKLIASHFMANE